MAEAEFISDLLLAMEEGIREGKQSVLDAAYKKYDDEYSARVTNEKRFRDNIDTIGNILGDEIAKLRFKSARLFYPLFCSIHHLKFGLPKLDAPRTKIKVADYPKLKNVLENADDLIDRVEASVEADEILRLSAEQRRFFDAYDEHWVHADKRTILTQYLCRHFVRACDG